MSLSTPSGALKVPSPVVAVPREVAVEQGDNKIQHGCFLYCPLWKCPQNNPGSAQYWPLVSQPPRILLAVTLDPLDRPGPKWSEAHKIQSIPIQSDLLSFGCWIFDSFVNKLPCVGEYISTGMTIPRQEFFFMCCVLISLPRRQVFEGKKETSYSQLAFPIRSECRSSWLWQLQLKRCFLKEKISKEHGREGNNLLETMGLIVPLCGLFS